MHEPITRAVGGRRTSSVTGCGLPVLVTSGDHETEGTGKRERADRGGRKSGGMDERDKKDGGGRERESSKE